MRWTFKPNPEKEKTRKLVAELHVDSIIARLLLQRGIETYDAAKIFFRPNINDLVVVYVYHTIAIGI